MIQVKVVSTGGKFIFKPGRDGKYSADERKYVRLAIAGGISKLIRELQGVSPEATGALSRSWRVILNGNQLGTNPPDRPDFKDWKKPKTVKNSKGDRTTGVSSFKRRYKLGDKVMVENLAPYAWDAYEGAGLKHGRYSKDPAKYAMFGANVEAAISNFELAFDEARGV